MVSLILLEVFLEYGIYVMRFFEILTVMTLSSDIPTDMLRFLLGTHCLFANALCNSPYGLRQAHAFAAVCSSQRKPRNCLWEYPRTAVQHRKS